MPAESNTEAQQAIIVAFEEVEFIIHDVNGGRWVTARQLGEALGYHNHRKLIHLIHRYPDEFTGKTCVPKLGTGCRGEQDTLLINYHGVIRAAMLAKAPRAKRFRDWAEQVLFQVMTVGFYNLRGKRQRYIPPSGPRIHWTEMLSPKDALSLAKIQAKIWLKLAMKPNSRALWNALYATFGGPSGYVQYLEMKELGTPVTPEEWAQFEELHPFIRNTEGDQGGKS